MPYSHLNDYPAAVREHAARVRLACFDVAGTLTDGRLFFDTDGRELKAFHVHDGQGLVLLRKAGIAVAFVTARASSEVERRGRELRLPRVHTGERGKLACMQRIAARSGRSSPMKATSSMPRPSSPAIRCMQASLPRSPVCTRGSRSSRPRRSTSVLVRAVTKATSTPASRSSTRPMPSCTWKALASSPLLA